MAGRDYDNRYDRREYPARPRPYDDPDREPVERPVSGGDRMALPPLRRPYSDRELPQERPVRREEDPSPYAEPVKPVTTGVTLTEPKSFMDVQDLIDKLRRGESIIVNLKSIEAESAQRILDFLSGASYALGGAMCRVEEKQSTFLVTPRGTGITDNNDNRYPR